MLIRKKMGKTYVLYFLTYHMLPKINTPCFWKGEYKKKNSRVTANSMLSSKFFWTYIVSRKCGIPKDSPSKTAKTSWCGKEATSLGSRFLQGNSKPLASLL